MQKRNISCNCGKNMLESTFKEEMQEGTGLGGQPLLRSRIFTDIVTAWVAWPRGDYGE